MFQLFPKQRQDWMLVFEFPFQAFVVLSPVSLHHFMRLYDYYANNVLGPRLYSFDCIAAAHHLETVTAVGYLLCFIALMVFGFYHKVARHQTRVYVNFFFAALAIVDFVIMPLSMFAVATS
jgi:hypothetical protein